MFKDERVRVCALQFALLGLTATAIHFDCATAIADDVVPPTEESIDAQSAEIAASARSPLGQIELAQPAGFLPRGMSAELLPTIEPGLPDLEPIELRPEDVAAASVFGIDRRQEDRASRLASLAAELKQPRAFAAVVQPAVAEPTPTHQHAPRALPAELTEHRDDQLVLAAYVEESAEVLLVGAERAASSAITHADFSQVIAHCAEVFDSASNEDVERSVCRLAAWAYNRRGLIAEEHGDSRSALADFHDAVVLDPDSWQPVHNRGVSRAARKLFDLAVADFDRAIKLEPQSLVAYQNRGQVMVEMGNDEAASRDFGRAIQLDPGRSDLWRARARAHHRLGNAREAVRDFNRSLQLDSEDPGTYVERGKLYADLGYPGQALVDFQAALTRDGEYAPAHQAAGWVLATSPLDQYRHPEKAIAAARRAVDLAGQGNPKYLDTLAAAFASASRFAAAKQMQQTAIRLAHRDGLDTKELRHRLLLYEQGRSYQSPRAKIRH